MMLETVPVSEQDAVITLNNREANALASLLGYMIDETEGHLFDRLYDSLVDAGFEDDVLRVSERGMADPGLRVRDKKNR